MFGRRQIGISVLLLTAAAAIYPAPASGSVDSFGLALREAALVVRACPTRPTGWALGRRVQDSGWVKVAGGAGTRCALGTPYSFWVHTGDPQKLMIYFEGGGACWNAETCDVERHPSFDPTVDSTDDPARGRGILSLTNAENPVRDYTILFVPYCTADTFLGDTTLSFVAAPDSRQPGRTFTIHFDGAVDADDAMRWAWANVPDPRVVFVTGSSAGAIPSPFYAAQAANHWPRARVVALGDAGGGYRAPGLRRLLATTGVLEALRRDPYWQTVDSVTHPDLYIVSAREAPQVTFAQYNAVEDSVQTGFQRLLGIRDQPLAASLSANLREIRSAVPGFRSYTAPGYVHTILPRPRLYTLTVDGVRFRDWLADLLAGHPVSDVGNDLLGEGKQ